jgi:hypothetical protein
MSPFVVPSSEGVIPFDSAVNRLEAQFGVENRATIVAVVNEKQREMLAFSEYRAMTPSIGTTATGQVQYPISDANVESYRLLRVGSVMYERVGTRTLWELQDTYSDVNLSGPGGVFAPAFGDDGTRFIELYPEPDAGLTIEVLDYAWVSDSAYGDGSYLAIPTDVFPKLLAGCRAYLYRELEERPDLAAPEEEDFQAGILEARARKNRRVGGGAARARVGVGGRW